MLSIIEKIIISLSSYLATFFIIEFAELDSAKNE